MTREQIRQRIKPICGWLLLAVSIMTALMLFYQNKTGDVTSIHNIAPLVIAAEIIISYGLIITG